MNQKELKPVKILTPEEMQHVIDTCQSPSLCPPSCFQSRKGCVRKQRGETHE